MYAQPGKKLLFMGAEFAQGREWDHDSALEWVQAGLEPHAQIGRWLQDLNGAYRSIPALHEGDTDPEGFAWVDTEGAEHSVVAFLRRGRGSGGSVLALFNFTPVPRPNYQVGVPVAGRWLERLNSDARLYGGAGWGNLGGVETSPIGRHGHPQSLTVTLPPLGALLFTAPG
jgi:1,4-alpha-glucan branching enzyme